jgi:hypothetical protein
MWRHHTDDASGRLVARIKQILNRETLRAVWYQCPGLYAGISGKMEAQSMDCSELNHVIT